MNKRIKELAEQAGLTSAEYNGFDRMDLTPSEKKFAELILQDIDEIIVNLYHAMPLEQAAVLLTLDENIKEHFYGVD